MNISDCHVARPPRRPIDVLSPYLERVLESTPRRRVPQPTAVTPDIEEAVAAVLFLSGQVLEIEGHDLRAIAPVEYAAPNAPRLLAELISHTDTDFAVAVLVSLAHELLVERRKHGIDDSRLTIPPTRGALLTFAA